MTEAQQHILHKVVREIGFTVLRLSDELGESFLIGTCMIPDGGAQVITFCGFEATSLFTATRRDIAVNQLAAELDTLRETVSIVNMKFPLTATWRLYSK